MKKFITAAAFAAVACTAVADMSEGPIVAQQDSDFTVRLVSSSAGWTGWLGWISNTESEPVALLSNKGPTDAAPIAVGSAQAGEAVIFQYEITRGTPNTYRQDDEAGARQFRHEWLDESTARLFVEDIQLPGGDRDYNDAVFDVAFTPVPTPGTMAMGLAAGGLLVKRRR
jgi:uncharacterized protein (TIGR03382 family)